MKLIKAKKYLCMLLAAMLVSAAAIGVNAEELITGIGDWLVDIGISEDSIDDYPVEDELVPQAATACERHYNHYEVTETWDNDNIKIVTHWVVDKYGDRVGTETWTINYPRTGDEALKPYGQKNGFKGCFCPNCEGLYD